MQPSDTPWLRDSRPLLVALLSARPGTVPGVAFCRCNEVQDELRSQGAYHLNTSL